MLLIYSNTGEWGGVDMLIAGFARHLESRGRIFKIAEHVGGRLRSQIAASHFVECHQLHTIAAQVTHVFVPSIAKLRDERFPWNVIPNAKVLVWVVHPNDVFSCFFPFSGRMSELLGYRAVGLLRRIFRTHASSLDRLINQMVESCALASMDGATSRSLHYFVPSLSQSPPVVPIPSQPLDAIRFGGIEEALKVGYLGRMDSMKWSAVKPFLVHTLGPMTQSRPVQFHAVSEGSHISALVSLCAELGIELNLHGYLPNSEARQWLGERARVAVAMGTSALDLAGIGMPVIVLDPAWGLFATRQKTFRFIHESDDFTVGEYRDFPGYVAGGRTFAELCEPRELAIASREGRCYVRRSHDPDIRYSQIESLLASSRLSMRDLRTLVTDLKSSFGATKQRPLRAAFGISAGHSA